MAYDGYTWNSLHLRPSYSSITSKNNFYLVILYLTITILVSVSAECDRMFISSNTGRKNGTFTSPTFENPMNYSRQCLYTFIAARNERVKIEFTHFTLRGTYTQGKTISAAAVCDYEYMDIFMEVKDPSMELIDAPFGGRYCGRIPPRFRISVHNTMVLGFHTELSDVVDLFEGTYSFVNADKYIIGTPVPDTKCSFTISMENESQRSGNIISPTYPGVYPKGLYCSYKFQSMKNTTQRILIELMDFDLFYGGAHCPFDYVKFYDGGSNKAPLIRTYCGQHRKLRVYSNSTSLFMEFVTLQSSTDDQNRGFNGTYHFSESIVALDFINLDEAEHIRGTECDQKILSKKESNGTIVNPNYPFYYHRNVVCRYYIYGLEDTQNLERVQLKIKIFDVGYRVNDKCANGFLQVYLRGDDITNPNEDRKYVMCGKKHYIREMTSYGPRLVLLFSSQNSTGRGFKIEYKFETFYEIPGTAAADGSCDFTYRSNTSKIGSFNSPRHPKNYPKNLDCTYHLIGDPSENIELSFITFETAMDNSTFGYMENCVQDYVEIYEIRMRKSTSYQNLIGRYCGLTTPGPLITEMGVHKLLVRLHSDGNGVSGGFRATYKFLNPFETKSRIICGGTIYSDAGTGTITSPNFPGKYHSAPFVCEWIIKVQPNFKVILVFKKVEIEGDPKTRGCSPAAVQVWTDNETHPLEFCGQSSELNKVAIESKTSTIKIKFTTSTKAVGGKGFYAVWTRVLTTQVSNCGGFHCPIGNYCIDPSLVCNGEPNCGFEDKGDEINCVADAPLSVNIIIGITLGCIFVFIMGICITCRRRSRRKRAQLREREDRHKRFCDATGMRISSVDTI